MVETVKETENTKFQFLTAKIKMLLLLNFHLVVIYYSIFFHLKI